MAKGGTITRKELANDDVIRWGVDYAKNLQIAIDKTEELKKHALEFNTLSKGFKKAGNNKEFIDLKEREIKLTKLTSEAEKERNRALIEAQKIQTEKLRTEKLALDIEKKKQQAQKKSTQLTVQERYELSVLNKRAREAATLSSTLSTEYEKQSLRLLQLRRRYKDVALTQGESSNQARRLQADIHKLDSTLKRVDANVGQFQRNVGNYGKAMASAANAARSMASALGFTGGLFLFVQTMREANNIVRSFSKTMSNIAGIYRTNRKSLESLENKIISVAGASVNTATDVAKLAESLATLGKTDKEIETLLEPVNNLSIGLNAASDEAGEFLVQMLNTFGGSINEAGKYADIIATIRTSTSLDFQKMRDSFQYLAPISKALNKDIAYTGSLIGILADNGIKAERAGRLLGTSQQKLASKGKSLNDALEELNKAKSKNVGELELLKLASELFGKQSAALGVVLSNNTDLIEENANAIRENSGALNDLVNEQLQSLDAHFRILESRWEEYILNTDKSTGASNDLKKILKFLSDNLETVINTTVKIVKWFVIYKGVVLATNFAMGLAARANTLYRLTLIAINGGIKKVIVSMKAMKAATAASGVGLFLVILGSAYEIFQSFSDGANEAAKAQMTLNEAIKAGSNNINEYLSGLKNSLRLELDEVKEREKNNLSLAKSESEKIAIKKQSLNEQLKLIRDRSNLFKKEIEQREKDKKLVLEERKDALGASYIQGEIDERKKYLEYLKRQENEVIRLYRDSNKEKKEIDEKRRKQLEKDGFELERFKLKQSIEFEEDIIKNQEESLVKRLLSNKSFVDKSIELLRLESKEAIKNAKDRPDKIKQIELKFQSDKAKIEKEGQENAQKILEDGFNKRKKAIEDDKKNREQELQDRITQEQNNLNIALQREGLSLREREKLIKEHEKRVSKIKLEAAKENLKIQIAFLEQELKKEGYTKEQREQLAKLLSDTKLVLSQTTTKGIVADLEEQKEAERRVQEFKTEQIRNASNVIAESLNLDAANLEKFLNGIVDGFGEGIEGVLNGISSAASIVGDVMGSIYQGNIDEINNQIEVNDEYYNRQIELAEGDKAKQDLLRDEQEKKREELEKKKRKEQEKQAKFQKAAAIFQIGMNTAQAILGIWAQVPKFDFGVSAGIMTALVGALGLAQIAAVASKPIPKYAKGTEFHPGGKALVGEERPEVIFEPNKNPYIADKPSVLDLPIGTKVIPSIEEYKRLQRASIFASLDIENKQLQSYQEKQGSFNNALMSELLEETKRNTKAVQRSKTNVSVQDNSDKIADKIAHAIFSNNVTNWD
ncbi:phage tail tape measure protein [Tenacibaculum caenipelagi]|uniref:TP901 family phage tail tape measure protein n=1 Tax=Tenacibaculum caenipelagi TaxID=1325435 RepID=A0A4R6TFY6_9FLAO|nr:phage tail tape measure protein [Tenacibaculum caenipelagi]TDQ27626.1 TP901 family phage tail tape measure protein [Tenacibaculum caenipelagi]